MLYEAFYRYFEIFLVVFVRMVGMFTSAPFFSGQALPMRVKLSFAFFVSLVLVPLVVGYNIPQPQGFMELGADMVVNFVIGFGLGSFVYFCVSAFQNAAHMFSMQMGMGINEVYDPMSEQQTPALGNVLGILILLLFLRVDGHIYLVQVVAESFRSFWRLDGTSLNILVKSLGAGIMVLFDTGLRIAFPVIAVSLLLDVAVAMIGRVAPQFNVMIMGFHIKLIVGFVVLWLFLPVLVNVGEALVDQALSDVYRLVRMIKQGGGA
ncbi:flagellar biosynthetic protein FliR [Thermospira aquatica]|uniref:Flagellar biosynthetic protein FliR n=1 Tax=Thermospira aquatica TaxID=2828656 RepID=A0AAX3BAK3_9SPIR|nr:flagellar biosynthetic protein FliR [Thermospira aquatica]URA09093.1 flagellar biosynthetic protein FliR [Thermospira aquatica]